jgi:deoxyribonuclease V
MDFQALHSWDLTPKEAVALQRELAGRVDVRQPLASCALVAGADCSYNRFSPQAFAAVVVLRTSDWSVVESATAHGRCSFPYVPGLLSFREIPVLLQAFAQLKHTPDAVMCDGQGYAHPRRMGLASHLGLWLGVPTIGCAKSRLCGTHREPGFKRGRLAQLRHEKEVIGHVLRTRDGVKPLYISAGHRIDLPSAVRLVLAGCRGYRIPEPTRLAHMHVNELRRRVLSESLP